jgi:hypothetical protein
MALAGRIASLVKQHHVDLLRAGQYSKSSAAAQKWFDSAAQKAQEVATLTDFLGERKQLYLLDIKEARASSPLVSRFCESGQSDNRLAL